MIELDRRDFLKLAAAAGMTAAGSPWLSATAFGQSQSPSASGEPAAAVDPIADLAASLGHDLERIFRFVQEEIRYEPYAGILRGATGTLLTRAGNSADQAVLLGALLAAASVPHRFVMGVLDGAAVAELAASIATDAATAVDDVTRVLSGVDGPIPGADPEIPAASAIPVDAGAVASGAPDAPVMRSVALRQTQAAVDTILGALADAGTEIPSTTTGVPDTEQREHMWVQASLGETWIDLDPAFATIAIGDRAAEPGEPLDALPDDLRHRIDFIVTAERFLSGALATEVILEASAWADELLGVPITFTHLRSDRLADIDIIGAGLGAEVDYNAVLTVGPKVLVGTSTISFGGSGGDLFGDALGGGGGGLVDGEATAEWLVVRTSAPGASQVTARRAVFDRIGQAARSAGAIDPHAVPPAELVDTPESSREYLPCRSLDAFSVATGTVHASTLLTPPPSEGTGVHSWLGLAYHYVRDALLADAGLQQGVAAFLDAPCITSVRLRFADPVTGEGGAASLDVWHRSFGTRPVTDLGATAPGATVAGVISHVAERILWRDGIEEPSATSSPPISVGAIFEQARSEGVGIRTIVGSLPSDLPYSPDAVALMGAAVDAGRIVIVPAQPLLIAGRPRIGWWSVDPATGRTDDRMDDGSGGATVEYKVPVAIMGGLALACLANFGDVILALVQSALFALGVRTPLSVDAAMSAAGSLASEYRENTHAAACLAFGA